MLRALCKKCGDVVDATISGDAYVRRFGCDSCNYGRDIVVSLTVTCPRGHTIHKQDGLSHGA